MKRNIAIAILLTMLMTSVTFGAAAAEETTYSLPDFEITSDVVTLVCWESQKVVDNEDGWMYEINRMLMDHYGCSIKIVRTTYEELPNKVASLVLSGNAPDLIFYKDQDFPAFIQKNLVMEVSDYLDFSDPLFADLQDTADNWLYNGGYYFFPCSKMYNDSYVYYWKEYFTDAGMDTPLDLYHRGEWTLGAMREMMYDLTMDEDRDGIVDIYGLTNHPHMCYYITGEDFVTFDSQTGLFSNNLRSAGLTPFFDFMYNVSSAGDGSRLMALNTTSDFKARKAVMSWEQAWVIATVADEIKNGEVEIAPAPILDGSDRYYTKGRVDGYWIGNGAANPGGAAAVLAIMRYMELDPDEKAKNDTKAQEKYGWTDEQLALFNEMNDPDIFDMLVYKSNGVGSWGNVQQWPFWNNIGLFEVPWSTTVEEYYPILQEQIDIANASE